MNNKQVRSACALIQSEQGLQIFAYFSQTLQSSARENTSLSVPGPNLTALDWLQSQKEVKTITIILKTFYPCFVHQKKKKTANISR